MRERRPLGVMVRTGPGRPAEGGPLRVTVRTGGPLGVVECTGAGHVNGDQLCRTLTPANNLAGQRRANVLQSGHKEWVDSLVDLHTASSVRDENHRIVRRALAIYSDGIKSFVRDRDERLPQPYRIDRDIGGEEAEHRGHPRLDHA